MHAEKGSRSSMVTLSLISYVACTSLFVSLWFSLIKINIHASGFNDNFMFGNFVQQIEVINITITKRSLSHIRNQFHTFWIVSFRAFCRQFQLVLFPRSHQLLLPGREIVVHRRHTQDRWRTEEFFLVEGSVVDENYSKVRGSLDGDSFAGVIFVGRQELYVNKIGNSSVIYQQKDGEEKPRQNCKFSHFKSETIFQRRHKRKSRRKRDDEETKFVCSLKLFADHTFYLYSSDRTARGAINTMLRILDDVNSIFYNTDFNLDGEKGEFQFVVGAIHIFADEDARNYRFHDENLTSEELLQRLTYYNLDDFCLGIAFVYRTFPDGVTGIGYPYDNDPLVMGGICDSRISPFREKYKERSFNVLVVSIRSPSGEMTPHDINVVNLAHQLGHSMGSDHDNPKIRRCYPNKKKGGPYIMSKTLPVEKKRNYFKFSPCSRRAMHGTFMANSNCLKATLISVCGNGVKEEHEECDCGDETQCRLIDSCCMPKSPEMPMAQCTLRRKEGAICSPRHGYCCTESCRFVTAYQRKDCTQGNECLEPSICSGNMSKCPKQQPKMNGIPCRQGLGACFNGICLDVYCQRHNMTECECNRLKDACKVCCEKDGICQTANYWGISNRTDPLRTKGEICQRGRGICNKGICRLHGPPPPPVYLSEQSESLFPTYMIVMMSLVGTIVILLVVLVAVWTCARFIVILR